MGMGIFHKSSFSSYDKQPPNVVKQLPNPDPKNFKITTWASIGRWLIVNVHYPDCINYEGNKILVFKNVSIQQLEKQGSIDPHFSNNKEKFSPIARFVPTPEGWDMAITLCDAMIFACA